MLEAVGSMFTVSFDGATVNVAPRFHEGHLEIALGAVTAVALQPPRPLECGAIRFAVPSDPTVDGVRVSFCRPQLAEFTALHAAVEAAIDAGVANAGTYGTGTAAVFRNDPHDEDRAVIEALRATGVVADQDFGLADVEVALSEL